jgi:hypothetical protein
VSYNGSGTFNINTTGQPVVAGTVISSSAFNSLTTDLATGLTTAITKDGQTTTTARITFAQGIKDSTLTASSAVATDASKNLVSVTNTGTGNNVLATSPTITTPTISSLSSASATALTLQSAGTTAITVDTSQNVGVGVTPSAWGSSYKAIDLNTYGAITSSTGEIRIWGNAYQGASSYIYKTTSAATLYDMSGGAYRWYTAASGTAGNAISFTQSLSLGKGTTLALEGATSQSGTGITFPVTQSASSNAKTLDDYEEGTWTPSNATAGTFTSIVATYTKIGRQVTLNARWTMPSTASGAPMSISGIPFAVGSGMETTMAIFDNAGLGANQVYLAASNFDVRAAGSGTERTLANFSLKNVLIMVTYST